MPCPSCSPPADGASLPVCAGPPCSGDHRQLTGTPSSTLDLRLGLSLLTAAQAVLEGVMDEHEFAMHLVELQRDAPAGSQLASRVAFAAVLALRASDVDVATAPTTVGVGLAAD